MNKLFRLVLVPLAFTLTEGCASFNGVIRSARSHIENATRSEPKSKIIANGMSCMGSASSSEREALKKMRKEYGYKIRGRVIQTIKSDYCAIVYVDDSKPESSVAQPTTINEDTKTSPEEASSEKTAESTEPPVSALKPRS
jgi:hypothetical protein